MVDNERQAAVPALEVVNVKFPEITTLQVNHALLLDLLLYTNYIKHLSLCPHFLLPTNCPLTVVWSLW